MTLHSNDDEIEDATWDKIYEGFDAANDVKFGTLYGQKLLQAISDNDQDKIKDIISMPREKAGILLLRLTQSDVNGNSALHLGVMTGNLGMVKLLLSEGIQGINAKNKAGETPMVLAQKLGHQNISDLLLGAETRKDSEQKN